MVLQFWSIIRYGKKAEFRKGVGCFVVWKQSHSECEQSMILREMGLSQTIFPSWVKKLWWLPTDWTGDATVKLPRRKDRIGFTSGGRCGPSAFSARCCISSMSVF